MLTEFISQLKQAVKASSLAKVIPSQSGTAKQRTDVFVGLASIPSREESLELVIKSLLPQASGIGVYLNNWEQVPTFLKHPKIQIARSQDHGDVRDNGKFFFIDKTNARFYATVDDDISYPSDYISTLVANQQRLGGTYAVGTHGSVYPSPVKMLLKQRFLWHFAHQAPALLPVDMLGTGTLLFERSYWNLDYTEFGTPGMADVWFAVAAQKRNFGLWVVPREADWMHPIELESEQDNLFSEGRLDDSVQVGLLRGANVGSTRGSLLEQIVRVPRVSCDFSVRDADALATSANRCGLEELEEVAFRLYDYALLIHKRETLKDLDPRLDELLSDYVAYLLHRVSGRIYANDVDFESVYKKTLKKIGFEALPEFAKRDWVYLKIKSAKTSV